VGYLELNQTACVVHRHSAEITKLAVNCFITMKISFSNMIGDMADRTLGARKEDILSAVGQDSRVGPKCMQWGYGFGGPCFPRDNRALGYYASLTGVDPLLTTATDEYNVLHARIMVDRLLDEKRDLVHTPATEVSLQLSLLTQCSGVG
jgi:UDP-glucose 6-dehydrogenase